jgi:hypothetical protein
MLFVAVTHLIEGLSLETLPTLKVEKSVNLFSGYTETENIHFTTTVNFAFEKVNKKQSLKILSPRIRSSKILSRVRSNVANNYGFWIR